MMVRHKDHWLAGWKYKVTETYVPQGYIKATDFEIEVTEKSDGSGVVAKVGEKEGQTIVYNRLAAISLWR